MYNVNLSKKILSFLEDLDNSLYNRSLDSLNELKRNPFVKRSGCDIKKLSGREDVYRLRVGSLRFEYIIDDDTVFVENVFFRNRGYR